PSARIAQELVSVANAFELLRRALRRVFFDLLQIGRTDIFISRVRLQLQDFARVIPWSERASTFSAQNRLRCPRDDGRCLFPGVPSGSRGPTIRFASSNRNWVSSSKFIAAKESSAQENPPSGRACPRNSKNRASVGPPFANPAPQAANANSRRPARRAASANRQSCRVPISRRLSRISSRIFSSHSEGTTNFSP